MRTNRMVLKNTGFHSVSDRLRANKKRPDRDNRGQIHRGGHEYSGKRVGSGEKVIVADDHLLNRYYSFFKLERNIHKIEK